MGWRGLVPDGSRNIGMSRYDCLKFCLCVLGDYHVENANILDDYEDLVK